jgi:hypothetical protein
VSYSVLLVWLIGPALVLAVFGIILFTRKRTLASALVALGFCAVVIGGIANALLSYDVSFMYGGMDKAVFAVAVQLDGLRWALARLCGPAGMWIASLSLLWQIIDSRDAVSPDSRGRAP